MLVPQTMLCMQAEQNNSLLPFDRQLFSHPQDSRTPSSLKVAWKDSYHNSKDQPPSPSFPHMLLLSKMSSGREYTAILLLTTSFLTVREWKKQGRPLCSPSTAQQELKHGCMSRSNL